MFTPKQLVDRSLPASERAVAEGRGSDPSGMPVMTARTICRGIEWLSEGTYAWLAPGDPTFAPPTLDAPSGPLPDGMVLTPEESARALLAALDRMPSMSDSGLTHRQVQELGRAMNQLAAGTYPYPLSAAALSMRAAVAESAARAA